MSGKNTNGKKEVGMAFRMPAGTHQKAKARARALHQSLQDFVCSATDEVASRKLSKREIEHCENVRRADTLRRDLDKLEALGY